VDYADYEPCKALPGAPTFGDVDFWAAFGVLRYLCMHFINFGMAVYPQHIKKILYKIND
jgi:hypothetical protein